MFEEEEEFAREVAKEKILKQQQNFKFEEQLRQKLVEQQKIKLEEETKQQVESKPSEKHAETKYQMASQSSNNVTTFEASIEMSISTPPRIAPTVVWRNNVASSETSTPEVQKTNTNEDPEKLKDLTQKAEVMSKRLQELLDQQRLDQEELNGVLRSLGQVAKGAYQATGETLNHTQLQKITESTQAMLKIGIGFKTSGTDSDSPQIRHQLLEATFQLINLLQDLCKNIA